MLTLWGTNSVADLHIQKTTFAVDKLPYLPWISVMATATASYHDARGLLI